MNTPNCTLPPSLDGATAPAAFGHAGGIAAISRRLSVATPPEARANQHASQRDASMHRERFRTLGPLACIPSGCASFGPYSGGVASLDHRLIAAMPPASDPSLSMIWTPGAFHNSRHPRALFIGVSSPPKDTIFFYPPKTAKNLNPRHKPLSTNGATGSFFRPASPPSS